MSDPERPEFEVPEFDLPEPEAPRPEPRWGLRILGVAALGAMPFVAVAALVGLWPRDDLDATVAALDADLHDGPVAADPAQTLEEAQARVAGLQLEIDARRAELDTLRLEQDDERDLNRKRQDEVVAEVERLSAALTQAQAQRDGMRARLRTALARLDEEVDAHAASRAQTVAYASANTENVWVAFSQRTKIDLCDQMTKRGRANCRRKLDGWLDAERHERFAGCVERHRTIPSVWKRPRGADVPANAELVGIGTIGERDDWYVLFCDPTLPEAQVAEATIPPTPPVFTEWEP